MTWFVLISHQTKNDLHKVEFSHMQAIATYCWTHCQKDVSRGHHCAITPSLVLGVRPVGETPIS